MFALRIIKNTSLLALCLALFLLLSNICPAFADLSSNTGNIKTSKNIIRADGKDFTTISIECNDETGKPLLNHYVSLSSSRDTEIITDNSIPNQGIYQFTISSNAPGQSMITANDYTDYQVVGTVALIFSMANAGISVPSSPEKNPLQKVVFKLQQNPTAQKVTDRILTPVSQTVVVGGFIPLVANSVATIPYGVQLFGYLLALISQALGIKRKPKPWGTVFNIFSGKPVDQAIVRLFRYTNKELVSTRITDANGRFDFTIKPGKYYATVSKPGYVFPIESDSHKFLTPGETNYLGSVFSIICDIEHLSLSIPIEPVDAKISLSTKLKLFLNVITNWMSISGAIIFIPLFTVGILISSFAAIIRPSFRANAILILYLLLLIVYLGQRFVRMSRLGVVLDQSGKPVEGVTVNVFDTEYKSLRANALTDSSGRFSLYVPEGSYYLTCAKPQYSYPPKKVINIKIPRLYKGEAIITKKPIYLGYNLIIETPAKSKANKK